MTNLLRPLAKSLLNRAGYHLVPTSRQLSQKMLRDLVDDPFVQFLKAGIGGWLSDDNVIVFEQAIKVMPQSGGVVEIGSFLGRSTTILSYALRKYARQNPFFNCDAWHYPDGLFRDFVCQPDHILLAGENYQAWVRES